MTPEIRKKTATALRVAAAVLQAAVPLKVQEVVGALRKAGVTLRQTGPASRNRNGIARHGIKVVKVAGFRALGMEHTDNDQEELKKAVLVLLDSGRFGVKSPLTGRIMGKGDKPTEQDLRGGMMLVGRAQPAKTAASVLTAALSSEDEKWLEDKLLEIIVDSYAAYRARPHIGEPRLSTVNLRDDLSNENQPEDIKFTTKETKTKMVRNALERLRRKGKIKFSWGAGRGSKEARFWEPAK